MIPALPCLVLHGRVPVVSGILRADRSGCRALIALLVYLVPPSRPYVAFNYMYTQAAARQRGERCQQTAPSDRGRGAIPAPVPNRHRGACPSSTSTQQVLRRLGYEELWDQIELPIAEAQPIEDHGHRCRAHAHAFMALAILRDQPRDHPRPATRPAQFRGRRRPQCPGDPTALPHRLPSRPLPSLRPPVRQLDKCFLSQSSPILQKASSARAECGPG